MTDTSFAFEFDLADFLQANVFDTRDLYQAYTRMVDEAAAETDTSGDIPKVVAIDDDILQHFADWYDTSDLEEARSVYTERLEELHDAVQELIDCTDFRTVRDGETVIDDNYFSEYARELAEDLGYIDRKVHWPYTHIDWDAAAQELRQDYSLAELSAGGEQYRFWIRG